MVKTSSSSTECVGSILSQEAKIPHALRPKSWNIKQKQYCNTFNKDFEKIVHIQKKRNSFLKEKELRRWFKVMAVLSFTQLWDLLVGFTSITMNRKERPVYVLGTEVHSLFWEGPQSKYFQIFRPSGLSGSYSTLLAGNCRHLWTTWEQMDVAVSYKTLFTKSDLAHGLILE